MPNTQVQAQMTQMATVMNNPAFLQARLLVNDGVSMRGLDQKLTNGSCTPQAENGGAA